MSVDGTDVPILMPSLFDRTCFSYKINVPGLMYQMELSTRACHNLWKEEAFRGGEFNDVQIFGQYLRIKLRKNEKMCADDGYGDKECFRRCYLEGSEKLYFPRILSSHETVNCMMKIVRVLIVPF